MRVLNKSPLFLYLSIAAFYVSSFSIAFMPSVFDDEGARRDIIANVLAALFWTGIVLGVVLNIIIRKRRLWDRHWMKDYKKSHKGSRIVPPLLLFFSNKPAIVFDLLLIAGFLTIIIYLFTYILPESLLWIIIFITVFSFEMHCVFNGLNYKWLRG